MPELPHGWRMRNSGGEVKGPSFDEDGFFSGDEENDLAEPLDIRPDSEGWDDLEDDIEEVAVKCFSCNASFPQAKEMIEHCKEEHDFDFLAVQQRHGLDFYKTIKLVNYVRSEVRAGKDTPDVTDPKRWEDDKYLQPTLEDDALLFSLDDLIETALPAESGTEADGRADAE